MTKHKIIIFSLIIFVLYIIQQPIYGQVIDTDSLIQVKKENFVNDRLLNSVVNARTSAVSSVSGEILYKTPAANLTNTLYGLIPGLTVMQGQGEPGYDAASLSIRGIGSYNYGSYAVFVDGFQTPLSYAQYLSPSEIESLSILKDAAALASFGMKGANGLIWIETKRGKIGKPQIKVQLRTGIQRLENITKPLGSYDYANLYNEANSNDNNSVWTPVYSKSQLEAYKNGTGINTDWYAQTLKNSTPFSSADLSFSGGNNVARYFVLANYTGSNGFYDVKNDNTHSNAGMQQYNIRSNLDFTMFQYIDGKLDFGGRIEDRSYPAIAANNLWSILARYPNNIYPVMNNNGTWTGTTVYPDNPVASIRELGIFTTHDRSMQLNFTLKERLDLILKGLYLAEAVSFNNWTRGSRNVTKDYVRYLGTVVQTSNKNTNYSIWDDYGTNQWNYKQFKATLGYNTKIGLHKIGAGLNYLQYTHNVDANQNGSAGINMNYGFVNFSGDANYSYADKYVAALDFGYSGSDNYRPGHRYVFYPSLSGAWIVSKEKFFADLKFVNFLKLRLSAGKTGYDGFSGGRYLYQQYYKYQGSYPLGNSTPTWQGGIVQAYIPDPNITAEQSMKYNLGLDASLLKNISFVADLFLDKRSGIVSMDNSIMSIVGADPPYRNLGKVTTKGMELSLSYKNNISDFNYNIGVMGTYLKDKIDYMAELATPSPYAMATGKAIGTPIGYEAVGFYNISDFDKNGNLINSPIPTMGKVQAGDIKYKDLNHDNIIDARDQKAIGRSSFPDFSYSLNAQLGYKNWDFRILMQGVAGRDVNLLSSAYNKVVALVNNGTVYEWAKNSWAYYPGEGIDRRASATYPRLSTVDNTNNYINSTFWIKNGDFLRLRNVELGYSLSRLILSRLNIKEGRIYINGMNLLTFSSLLKKYKIDPETMSGYPGITSYNVGLSLSF